VHPRLQQLAQVQAAVLNRERVRGADDVDVVGLDEHPVFDLLDSHRGALGEDFDKQTVAIGRQVKNQDERHAAVRTHRPEELHERFEPAGGTTHTHDEERQAWRLLGVNRLCHAIRLLRGLFHRRVRRLRGQRIALFAVAIRV
jgi:hypothetical protein